MQYDSAIASLSISLSTDASKFDPDGPLPPDLPETNASKTARESVERLAKSEGLTVRQLAQRHGGQSGLAFVSTPESISIAHPPLMVSNRYEVSTVLVCTRSSQLEVW